MANVRRWYILLVCAVSLQVTAGAVIGLLTLFVAPQSGTPLGAIAFQIAVILVGLPVFLAHWLWAQRLARRDADERGSALRRLYLFGTLAGFLAPFLFDAFSLAQTLFSVPGGEFASRFGSAGLSPWTPILATLLSMVVRGLLWFYHWRVTAADARAVPETGNSAAVRRLYLLGFSAAGLTMTIMGLINLLRWNLTQFGGSISTGNFGLIDELARLLVGVPLWVVFWSAAQRLFRGPSDEERESALRKLYLYAAVFIGALTVVSNATLILAGVFRRMLGLAPTGDIRGPLTLIVGTAVLWAYHAYCLRADAALAGEAPRQAAVRRLYLYLVAAVGLAAVLIGLGGDISVLINSFGPGALTDGLREELAIFTAALIAGLPVWLLPWRAVELKAAAAGSAGIDDRRSVVRKIYLYFFLFVATMTVLSSAVYVVYRLLNVVLDSSASGHLLADLAQAVAYGLIAIGLWLYHGWEVRRDGRLNRGEQAARLTGLKVAVVDAEDGRFGRQLVDRLRRELPGLSLVPIGLTPAAVEAMGGLATDVMEQLAGAGLLVAPWTVVAAGTAGGAVLSASARKLLIPMRADDLDWAGVDRWNNEALLQQTVQAVKQVAEGDEVKAVRPLGCGAIAGIVVAVLLLLLVAAAAYFAFGSRLF